jgi:hypothetical protein
MCHHKSQRRGVTTVQIAVMLAVIFLVVFAGAQLLGTRTNTKLGQSATDLANPKNLTTRFGS